MGESWSIVIIKFQPPSRYTVHLTKPNRLDTLHTAQSWNTSRTFYYSVSTQSGAYRSFAKYVSNV